MAVQAIHQDSADGVILGTPHHVPGSAGQDSIGHGQPGHGGEGGEGGEEETEGVSG